MTVEVVGEQERLEKEHVHSRTGDIKPISITLRENYFSLTFFLGENMTDEEKISFESRVVSQIIEVVKLYKREFIDKEYILISSSMADKKFFHISSKSLNFLHLTGVKTYLKPKQFYSYALSGKLETKYIYIPNKSVKGSVRRKLKSLFFLENFLNSEDLRLEEDLVKNKVFCKLATSNKKCTLGFVQNGEVFVPNTLLKNDMLDPNKSYPIDIIISKQKGAHFFHEIEKGSISQLKDYKGLVELLNNDLKKNLE